MIREQIGLECIHSPAIHELTRGIREHLVEMTGIQESERSAMALGLAHSLSRYKLKFSPDKVDTMIVQVFIISLSVFYPLFFRRSLSSTIWTKN